MALWLLQSDCFILFFSEIHLIPCMVICAFPGSISTSTFLEILWFSWFEKKYTVEPMVLLQALSSVSLKSSDTCKLFWIRVRHWCLPLSWCHKTDDRGCCCLAVSMLGTAVSISLPWFQKIWCCWQGIRRQAREPLRLLVSKGEMEAASPRPFPLAQLFVGHFL